MGNRRSFARVVVLALVGAVLLMGIAPAHVAAAAEEGACYWHSGQDFYRGMKTFKQCAVVVGKLGFTNYSDPAEGIWAGWTFRAYHEGSVTYEYQGRWYDAGRWRLPLSSVITYAGGKLGAYWADVYARWASGTVPNNRVTNSYSPPNIIRSYDAEMTVAGCTLRLNNATYCPANLGIYYDTAWVQEESDRYGDVAAISILAHEWGHHIQNLRRMPPPGSMLSINKERQADCYAGAFIGYAVENGTLESFEVWDAQWFLASVADPDNHHWDGEAHGDEQERLKAFNFGYSEGPDSCWVYSNLYVIVPAE